MSLHTRLSVNINKVALIRNARGSNMPDLVQVARDCEQFGAQGITVHPRPDERHVRYDDIPRLNAVVQTEFNIEGNPTERFLEMVVKEKPHQCTLVPDAPEALTSDAGWDTIKHRDFLTEVIGRLKSAGVRTSLFLDPDVSMVEGAVNVGADRIELYTGKYAKEYHKGKDSAIKAFVQTAAAAHSAGLGVNAGHDLNLENLRFFRASIPELQEVSIGHALVCDALYYGLQNVIQMYLARLS